VARPKFVQVPSSPLERYEPLLGDGFAAVRETAAECRRRYRRRAIWHVNSTMSGGGVAEMLRALLPYARGAGVDSRWLVLREDERFFALTKRLHNNLHGDAGDGGELGAAERRTYEHALATSARHFSGLLQPRDVVFLHDPQTAGLAAPLKATGAIVVWRCHIGADEPNAAVLRAQDFLLPYVRDADAWARIAPESSDDRVARTKPRFDHAARLGYPIDAGGIGRPDRVPEIVEVVTA
jgi:trehalose synthase